MLKSLSIATALTILVMACASGQQPSEYQVKAAFLSNFANFIEWPHGTFSGGDDPFTVCVLGRNPFGHALDDFANRKTADGRTFNVRQLAGPKDAAGCQIVFVSSSERLRYRALNEGLKPGILTVGDTDDFLAQGGTMELLIVDGRVQMIIDSRAARDRNLRISSHLLSLAKSVRQ